MKILSINEQRNSLEERENSELVHREDDNDSNDDNNQKAFIKILTSVGSSQLR